MPAEVETMFYTGDVPWHGLGTPVKDAPNSEIALHESGLDWEVISSPLYTPVGDDVVEVEGHFANVRSSDGAILGVVSTRYTVIQNRDAFAFTDELVGSGSVRYESAGSLFGGKKVWMLARTDGVSVLGDQVEPYLVFTNSHDGTSCVRVAMTPVRVVCNNTLNLALDGAERTWKFRHVGDIESHIRDARTTLQFATSYMSSLASEAEKLASIKVNDNQWLDMTEKLIPIPPNSTQRIERVLRSDRDDLYLRLKEVDNLSNFNQTGWGVVNAVADFADHRMPKRYTMTAQERRFELVTGGHPMVDAAYTMLRAA